MAEQELSDESIPHEDEPDPSNNIQGSATFRVRPISGFGNFQGEHQSDESIPHEHEPDHPTIFSVRQHFP